MSIRIINGSRYYFEKKNNDDDYFCYSVTEVDNFNRKISVTKTLPMRITGICNMIKNKERSLEKRDDKKVDPLT